MKQRFARSTTLIAAGAFALAACSSGGETPAAPAASSGGGSSAPAPEQASLSGTLAGAGSSAQESAMEAWRGGFTETAPDVTVDYEPSGSSGGREQFLAGGLDFAGSDAALEDEEIAAGKERCTGGDAIDLPLYVSPVAVLYNLEGVDELNLDADVLADIFNQKLTKWNDPAIAALNEGVTLPDLDITPVNRSDGSGTTENFTDYLAEAAGDKWPYEADSDFPVQGGEAAAQTSGMVSAIQAGNGTIGYADFSRAGELGVANILVGDEPVAPSAEGAAKLLDLGERATGRPTGDITLELPRTTEDPTAYPITLVAYSIVCTSYPDATKGNLVKAFFTYVASEQGQTAAATNAGSAPISEELRTDVMSAITAIKAGA